MTGPFQRDVDIETYSCFFIYFSLRGVGEVLSSLWVVEMKKSISEIRKINEFSGRNQSL